MRQEQMASVIHTETIALRDAYPKHEKLWESQMKQVIISCVTTSRCSPRDMELNKVFISWHPMECGCTFLCQSLKMYLNFCVPQHMI